MACSITGVGENIMRAALARSVSDRILDAAGLPDEACSAAIRELILDSPPPVRTQNC